MKVVYIYTCLLYSNLQLVKYLKSSPDILNYQATGKKWQ